MNSVTKAALNAQFGKFANRDYNGWRDPRTTREVHSGAYSRYRQGARWLSIHPRAAWHGTTAKQHLNPAGKASD